MNAGGYQEFVVKTECGRNFIWSALDLDNLLHELTAKGYRATYIMEYEDEVNRQLGQEELNHECVKAIERNEVA